jgi:hypothetical protein
MSGSTVDTREIIDGIDGLREEFEKFRSQIDLNPKDTSIPPSVYERPYDILYIPSKGKFYGGKDYLLIRPLTYFEENILTSEFLVQSGKGIDIVLKNLIVDDIDVEKLLPGDVQAITMFLRSQSYGDTLEMDMECGNCGAKSKEEFAISSFKMKEPKHSPNENGEFLISLPKSKMEIKLKLLTFKEEFQLDMDKKSYREKLKRMIVEVNGVTDRDKIDMAFKKMDMLESRKLRKFVEENTPGADANLRYTCGSCGEENELNIGNTSLFIHFPYSHRQNVLEEIFLISYYGKGITWDTACKMSVTERRWAINRINEEIKKKNEAERREYNKQKASSRSRVGSTPRR